MPAGSSVRNIIHWLQVNLPRFLPVPHRAALLPRGQPAVLLAARHAFVRSSLVLLSPPPQNARQISERSGPKGVGLSRETRGAEDPASASGTFQGPCFRPAPLLPCSPSAISGRDASGQQPIELITNKADYFSFFPLWAREHSPPEPFDTAVVFCCTPFLFPKLKICTVFCRSWVQPVHLL